MVAHSELESLKAEIIEGTNGRAKLVEGEEVYYGVVDGEVILL